MIGFRGGGEWLFSASKSQCFHESTGVPILNPKDQQKGTISQSGEHLWVSYTFYNDVG